MMLQAAKERYNCLRNFFVTKVNKGNNLFPDITEQFGDNTNDSNDTEKSARINQMALGGIVAVLAYRQTEHKKIHPVDELGQVNPESPYFKVVGHFNPEFDAFASVFRDPDVIKARTTREPCILARPHYALIWSELCDRAGLTCFFNKNISVENIRPTDIETIGKYVINGTLPFDTSVLEKAFPDMAEHLNHLATMIDPQSQQAQYCQIKKIFLQAQEATESNLTADGNDFRQVLNFLRIKTLNNFLAGTSKYTAEGAIHVANSALKLAQKVGKQEVTEDDVNSFKRATEGYQQDSWSVILVSILAGIAFGMLAGLLVGGILSSALAIPAILFVGMAVGGLTGGVTGLASAMWGKWHPIDVMAATVSIPLQPELSGCMSLT